MCGTRWDNGCEDVNAFLILLILLVCPVHTGFAIYYFRVFRFTSAGPPVFERSLRTLGLAECCAVQSERTRVAFTANCLLHALLGIQLGLVLPRLQVTAPARVLVPWCCGVSWGSSCSDSGKQSAAKALGALLATLTGLLPPSYALR